MKKLYNQFQEKGYCFIRNFFTGKDMITILSNINRDDSISSNELNLKGSVGYESSVTVWSGDSNDSVSNIFRYKKLVKILEVLLDDKVYLYHAKLNRKKPFTGGSWDWHQDFGFWYKNGCLYPDMLSVYVATSHSTVENGCLMLLEGSHKIGRLDHVRINEQNTIESKLLDILMRKFKVINCTTEPGDIIIFHSNILHGSNINKSKYERSGLIGVYNSKHNNPIKKHQYPFYYDMNLLSKKEIFKSNNERRKYVNNKTKLANYEVNINQ